MSNIRTARQDHERYCTVPTVGTAREWGRPGDVLRCDHDKVMLGYEVAGAIPAYWRTLSPVWTPILYRRAVTALRVQ